MKNHFLRHATLVALVTILFGVSVMDIAYGQRKIRLRLATSGSETDQRSVAMAEVFGPAVSRFANYQPSYNSTLFAQGTELEAMSRGNLEMSITSAQELAQFFEEFSIFTAGYVHKNAAHQVAVFNDRLMTPFKKKTEEELGVKLLSVMYLGRRQVNLRMPKSELTVRTPADLSGVNLRMPGTDAWQFLGKALGASPTPVAFAEVYTALSTGAIDGQDNPLPTMVDKKFYEVTKQVILTSHLVDLNYIAISVETWEKMNAQQQATVQKAADDAAEFGRKRQLELEGELVAFLEKEGLDVYEPNSEAFRKRVQNAYVRSDYAKTWPKGTLKRINALAK